MTVLPIIGIGYAITSFLAFVPAIYLTEARGWPTRPAFAVGMAIAVLGPISAGPLLLFILWLLGHFTVAGLREAWHIARPRENGGGLPCAKQVRR